MKELDAGAVEAAVLKLPPRIELLGGQRFKYVKLEDVLSILDAAPKTEPPRVVKPLEWKEEKCARWRAEAAFGDYTVYLLPDNSWAFEPPGLFGGKIGFRSPRKAMAAAQADYEARILSALTAAPASAEPVAWSDRVEAVKYAWEVMQGQCSEGDGFTERAAHDLDDAIDALAHPATLIIGQRVTVDGIECVVAPAATWDRLSAAEHRREMESRDD